MSRCEFGLLWAGVVVMASCQLVGWLGCFYAVSCLLVSWGPTSSNDGWYILGWMLALDSLVLVGLHCLIGSLYWFDRAAFFHSWKADLDSRYGPASALGSAPLKW